MSRALNPRRTIFLFSLLATLSVHSLLAAPRVSLLEPAESPRILKIVGSAVAEGQAQTPQTGGKAVALKSEIDAKWQYHEVRLSSSARDSEALRSLRQYGPVDIRVQIAEQVTTPKLRDSMRLIVAEGKPDGLRFFSPKAPLMSQELEVLDTPVDALTLLALLPNDPVEQGDSWKPAKWVIQFITGVEAVEKSELTCQADKVSESEVLFSIDGKITGGVLGAGTEITLKGTCKFDVKQELLSAADLTLTEKRSVSPVTTGLNLTTKIHITRSIDNHSALAPDAIKDLPTTSTPERLLILAEAPQWNLRWNHDRNWHVFHQTPQVAVLRLLDRGSLLAQCNISPITPAKPGEHMGEKEFQREVEKAIGKDFRRILKAETLPTQDDRYIYRVTSIGETDQPLPNGETKKIPLQWIYYLIASPTGQQIVLVMTLEPESEARFENQDISLALGMQFIANDTGNPTPANKPRLSESGSPAGQAPPDE